MFHQLQPVLTAHKHPHEALARECKTESTENNEVYFLEGSLNHPWSPFYVLKGKRRQAW